MSNIQRLILLLCWLLLHLVVSFVHLGRHLYHTFKLYLTSVVPLDKYRILQINKLRYLAVVVDSDEALCMSRVVKLLQWLLAIGVKHVSLYDKEGVVKNNKEMLLKNLRNSRLWMDGGVRDASIDQEEIALELLSFSDGKEAIAKAASFLCSKYLNVSSVGGNQKETIFTESDMDRALKSIGFGGPEPDLLLIYGPARCHLGFPAWRIRYTEIVHMGSLKSMKYGAILNAIYKFTKVKQNYGS